MLQWFLSIQVTHPYALGSDPATFACGTISFASSHRKHVKVVNGQEETETGFGNHCLGSHAVDPISLAVHD